MGYSYNINQIIQKVNLICDDADTFKFHRRYGYKSRIEEKLGSGHFLTALGLFSALGLLAKIYFLLTHDVDLKDYTNEYKEFKEKLKELGFTTQEFNKFLKKPRQYEINEADAFAEFILAYPNDIGLSSFSKDELKGLWNAYRNNLIHTLQVGSEVVITESIISNVNHPLTQNIPDVNNFQEERYKKLHKHSFYFLENKEKLRGVFLKHTVEGTFPMSLSEIIQATSDTLYIDDFIIDVRNMAKWLEEKFESQFFEDTRVINLKVWLDYSDLFHTYKMKLPEGLTFEELKKVWEKK